MNLDQLRLFNRACRFAADKHAQHRRKDGITPYINHPLEVVDNLTQAGVADYRVLCAGILHDTV